MKTTLPLLLLALLLPFGGHAQKNTSKTIDNLKDAIRNEWAASSRYAAFSQAALKINQPAVAKLFAATSRAESFHASNHKRVLELLGGTLQPPPPEQVVVKTTAENLTEAIKGETHEFTSMYPEYLTVAEKEDISEAIVTFRYALETEKKHAALYQSVLKQVNANDLKAIPSTWYVCPTCGNVYDPAGVKLSCEFCGTLKPRFIVF
jgi:rubrerythrin